MSAKLPLIVLKFGGSVLLDEHRLRIAVHEIYRWRRDGYMVVAVVSALAGRTQELVAQCDTLCDSISRIARAGIIAGGELESASLLGVHLDRAGIPAKVLTPLAVRLLAHGDPLDANPLSVDLELIDQALEHEGVVVFPGFVAMNESAETVVLGRGGSDLTAVFLAHELGAQRCRLIKDVDGLYTRDPANQIHCPPRYASAHYADALQTDGSIIQHKAVSYARRNTVEFELGRFNGINPTMVNSSPSVYDRPPDRSPVLSIAICGLGVVGQGVLELVSQLPDAFCVDALACRTPEKHQDLDTGHLTISDDPIALASSGADVLVELIGGTSTAWEVVSTAIRAGCHVVSANKALIASHGSELTRLAYEEGVRVCASGSVGGVMPILESLSGSTISSVYGVLNGTGNFVLGAIAKGQRLQEATSQAQQLGFAEADPSRDLDGLDSLDKLMVIAQSLGWNIPPEKRTTHSIGDWIENRDVSDREIGGTIRHIARIDAENASVAVEITDAQGVFGQLENEWNAVTIEYEDGQSRILRGRGAGRWPTSEAVLADLLELNRSAALGAQRPCREVADDV